MIDPSEPVAGQTTCPRCGLEVRDVVPGRVCPLCSFNLTSTALENGTVLDHRPCLQCGYSLTGLRADGRCPECGAEVARSLQGNLLVYSSPHFVSGLRRGATCILWGLVLLAVWVVSHIIGIARTPGAAPFVGILSLAGSGLGLIGWWLVSSPDPAFMGEDRTITARRVLRASVLVSLGAFLLGNGLQWYIELRMQTAQSTAGAPRPFPTLARQVVVACLLINVVIWPVKTIASLIYVRSLALRLPNLILLRRAKFLIRLALVIVVGVALIAGISALLSSSGVLNAFSAFIMLFMCAGFIAVLSWCITYAALIGGLRRDLVVISRRQSEPGNPVRTSHYH